MARHKQWESAPQTEESVFVSMTDIMVGLLFLFILMLMFFVLKYSDATAEMEETNKELISSEDTRTKILTDLEKSLYDVGVSVQIDIENGILRLPENILFEREQARLMAKGQEAVVALGTALDKILPCYAFVEGQGRPVYCLETKHSIESVFVEGHTDSDGSDELNWQLSVQRSLNTYKTLVSGVPSLASLSNSRGQALLSVSGYGKHRPVFPNDSDEHKRQNRRIDLRFIMTSPKPDTLLRVESDG